MREEAASMSGIVCSSSLWMSPLPQLKSEEKTRIYLPFEKFHNKHHIHVVEMVDGWEELVCRLWAENGAPASKHVHLSVQGRNKGRVINMSNRLVFTCQKVAEHARRALAKSRATSYNG